MLIHRGLDSFEGFCGFCLQFENILEILLKVDWVEALTDFLVELFGGICFEQFFCSNSDNGLMSF